MPNSRFVDAHLPAHTSTVHQSATVNKEQISSSARVREVRKVKTHRSTSRAPGMILGHTFINFRPHREAPLVNAPYTQLLYAPMNLPPMVPGTPSTQGVWQPLGTDLGPGYALFDTQVTPSAGSPPVEVVWMNQRAASLQLYAGTSQPGGTWVNEGGVQPSLQSSLLAAFEGGFQFSVANGGWYANGKTAIPLRAGAASIVSYQNGTINIGAWGSDVTMTPQVTAVRQNLDPLVSGGAVTPLATVQPLLTWGYSLGNLVNTWRSGLGITANGDLIWVGGPGLSPLTLGQTLVWAGAVRGLQLDINPDWVNFATYSSSSGHTVGSNLLPEMYFPPSHYLGSFWRDFVAVFARPRQALP